jgi:hypothetical protein
MGAGDSGPPAPPNSFPPRGQRDPQLRWWIRKGVILRPTFCHTSVVSVHLRRLLECTGKD